MCRGINLGWWRTFRPYTGAFFNLFLRRDGRRYCQNLLCDAGGLLPKTTALLSVLVDRMVGMLGLVAITVVPALPTLISSSPTC